MIFKKRNQCESILKNMEEKLQILETKISAGDRKLEDLHQNMNQLEVIHQNIKQLQTSVNKHDMSIEDLLEKLEDKRSEDDIMREQFRSLEQNEKHLLELFEAYQEHFFRMKQLTQDGNETLYSQMELMEKNLEHYRQLCGIVLIEECGISVDYDLHEVIEVVATDNVEQDKTVAGIYNYGYIYKGSVKKKAKIATYRLEYRMNN